MKVKEQNGTTVYQPVDVVLHIGRALNSEQRAKIAHLLSDIVAVANTLPPFERGDDAKP